LCDQNFTNIKILPLLCPLQGCGFIEFTAPEEAEAAMKLDGREVLGR
jgi:hypothetical protein